MTSFVIRRVDISDVVAKAAVNQLIDEVSKGLDWIYGEKCKRGEWWVAFDARKPAAFAGMVPMADYFAGAYLCASGVLAEYRGLGLQRRLIKKRIVRARELRCAAIYSDTMHHNVVSANNLIACGFRQFSPVHPWGDARHVHFWRLEL